VEQLVPRPEDRARGALADLEENLVFVVEGRSLEARADSRRVRGSVRDDRGDRRLVGLAGVLRLGLLEAPRHELRDLGASEPDRAIVERIDDARPPSATDADEDLIERLREREGILEAILGFLRERLVDGGLEGGRQLRESRTERL